MVESSPSFERRQRLRDADSGNRMQVLESYPLRKYLDIATRLLYSFQEALDQRRLDEAYIYGLRFATFCVESLPKHPDYNRATFAKDRKRNSQQVDKVLKLMEVVTQRMDAEEIIKLQDEQEREVQEARLQKEKQRKKKAEQERKEAEEQERREAALREQQIKEEQQRQEEEQRREEESKKEQSVAQSAMAKLQAMQSQIFSSKEPAESKEPTAPPPKPKKELKKKKTTTKVKAEKAGGISAVTGLTDPAPTTNGSTEASKQDKRVAQHSASPSAQTSTATKAAPATKISKTPVQPKEPTKTKKNSHPTAQKQPVKPTSSKTPASDGPKTATSVDDKTHKKHHTKAPDTKPKGADPIAFDSQSKTANVSAKPPTKTPASKAPAKPRPKTKEEKTIGMLYDTIAMQEKRLESIETVQIPTLLKQAKTHLKVEKDRKAALGCLARKKRLEQQMDALKAAIFTMETQAFMLENALENRQVQQAMEDASMAMKDLQHTIGDPANIDLTDLTAALPAIPVDLDEEEMMEELEEWISPQENKKDPKLEELEDEATILSLPTVPDSPAVEPSVTPEKRKQTTVQKLFSAVLG